MQVDYATLCHTLVLSVFEKLSSAARLRPFHSNKYPYSKSLRNPYVQSVRSLSPRKGNSQFETSKFQVIDSARIQANQPPLVEETAGVFFLQNNENKPNEPHIHI